MSRMLVNGRCGTRSGVSHVAGVVGTTRRSGCADCAVVDCAAADCAAVDCAAVLPVRSVALGILVLEVVK